MERYNYEDGHLEMAYEDRWGSDYDTMPWGDEDEWLVGVDDEESVIDYLPDDEVECACCGVQLLYAQTEDVDDGSGNTDLYCASCYTGFRQFFNLDEPEGEV